MPKGLGGSGFKTRYLEHSSERQGDREGPFHPVSPGWRSSELQPQLAVTLGIPFYLSASVSSTIKGNK
jgi:hypothetical protein